MKMPTTRDEYLALDPFEQMTALAYVLEESADRCEANMLLAGTWVSDTLRQSSADLKHAALRAAVISELGRRTGISPKS